MRVVFLGRLGDLVEGGGRELPAPLDWGGLLAALPEAVAEELLSERVRVACAGRVLDDKTMLAAKDGEEVALLPPVSGG